MKHALWILGLAGLLACGGKQPAAKQTHTTEQPARTARVEKAPGRLEVAGTVRAADVAELASRFGGFVRKVNVRAGDRVNAGDLLLVLDDRSLQAQKEKASAAQQEVTQGIEEARQNVTAAEAQKQLASNTFERIRSLYEKKSASLQEFEEAQSRRDSAEAAYKASQERLAQSESKLKQAHSDSDDVTANLSYQRITAPFNGIVTTVGADEGTFATPGQMMVTMENPGRYQLLFSVEQELLPSVASNQRLEVRIAATEDVVLEATVNEVSPSVDSATRTFLVKADLPASQVLYTGLSGRVVLSVPSRSSLWIPAEFLARQNDIETVLVRTGEDWRRVLVKSGDREGARVEILSGLNEGEEISIQGAEQ